MFITAILRYLRVGALAAQPVEQPMHRSIRVSNSLNSVYQAGCTKPGKEIYIL
jgi:hypothetical protein